MNIDNLTEKEKLELLSKLEAYFGWYPVASVCVEDVKEHLEGDEDSPMPTDDQIARACKYVARKAEEDISHLIEWAAEVAQELQEEEVAP